MNVNCELKKAKAFLLVSDPARISAVGVIFENKIILDILRILSFWSRDILCHGGL